MCYINPYFTIDRTVVKVIGKEAILKEKEWEKQVECVMCVGSGAVYY